MKQSKNLFFMIILFLFCSLASGGCIPLPFTHGEEKYWDGDGYTEKIYRFDKLRYVKKYDKAGKLIYTKDCKKEDCVKGVAQSPIKFDVNLEKGTISGSIKLDAESNIFSHNEEDELESNLGASKGRFKPAKEGDTCYIDADCGPSMHCFKGAYCISNMALKRKKLCDSGCADSCENCIDGVMNCLFAAGTISEDRCVECFMDTQCVDGFICEKYECVLE